MKHATHRPRSLIPEGYSLETTFDVLRTRQSRAVVTVLADRDAPVSLRGLASAVAGRLRDPAADDAETPAASGDGDASPRDLALELHHSQLPPLDDAGVVDYDAAEHVVTPVDAESFAPLVDAFDEDA